MVAWSSGRGDGAYRTWIGRDEAGAVVCFVADMLLLPDPGTPPEEGPLDEG